MAIVLGANQYGKAEIRLLHVSRDGGTHTIRDLNVTVTLSGELAATHLTGDNTAVLTTDAQKNTVFAFAKQYGVDQIEDFALLLARHFVDSQAAVTWARITVEQYTWERLGDHSFCRSGREVRTAMVSHDGRDSWVVSGLRDLILLNSAGSEFWGFARDRYTTLAETTDRILATAVNARWRHAGPLAAERGSGGPTGSPGSGPGATGSPGSGSGATGSPGSGPGWADSYGAVRDLLLAAFADTYSYSLQQTLFAMGRRVLDGRPDIAEIRLSLPNRHHFEVDMSPFGLENAAEVFYAADRPYGLIEGTVTRDEAPPPGKAW